MVSCAGYFSLHWRYNDHDGVSNHQPQDCLLNRLFGRRSKKTSKLRVTGLCAGNSPGPVNFPQKWPVTRKMFPFDDVIMYHINCDTTNRDPSIIGFIIPQHNDVVGWVGGVYWFNSGRPSVCLSVRLFVRPSHMPCQLCNTNSSGWIVFILGTMITSMRGCVAHNDIWPWAISSRSFSHEPVQYNC